MPLFFYEGGRFPSPNSALDSPNGLLAVSSDLTAEYLLSAYASGIFPWSNPEEPILWWSPDPRLVLLPERIRVTRSLKKNIRNMPYDLRIDTAFESVMRACGAPRANQAGTWISEAYISAYTELHRRGLAHSIEIWMQDTLVGGLYGVSIGRMFYGESMFSTVKNASKIALAFLAFFLLRHRFVMIDCQVSSPHLLSMGAIEVPRVDFLRLLAIAIQLDAGSVDWRVSDDLLALFRSASFANDL